MTLDDWLLDDRPLPARYRVMESLCEIVQEAHSRGRTHGAIKPANVEINSDLQCELDFARRMPPLAASDVPSYLAPELAGGGAPTPKSDIFSTGVVMYEVLAGTHPFVVETPLGKVTTDLQPPALRTACPDVSRDLADAVTACIERDPEWRPTDLGYVLEVLRRLRGDFSPGAATAKGAAKSAKAKAVAAPRAQARAAVPAPSFARPSSERRFPVIPVIIAVGVVLAAGVGLWLRSLLSNPSVPGPSSRPVASGAPTPVPTPTEVALASPGPGLRSPSAKPSATPSALPSAEAVPSPSVAAPIPTPVAATPPPTPTPRPATPAPTPTPTAVAAVQPTPQPSATPQDQDTPPVAAAVPASLTAVSPFKLKNSGQALLDVHGHGLRADHQAVLLKGKAAVAGFVVTRQRFMNESLVMVFVRMDGVVPGKYTLAMTDNSGNLTNALRLEITQ